MVKRQWEQSLCQNIMPHLVQMLDLASPKWTAQGGDPYSSAVVNLTIKSVSEKTEKKNSVVLFDGRVTNLLNHSQAVFTTVHGISLTLHWDYLLSGQHTGDGHKALGKLLDMLNSHVYRLISTWPRTPTRSLNLMQYVLCPSWASSGIQTPETHFLCLKKPTTNKALH